MNQSHYRNIAFGSVIIIAVFLIINCLQILINLNSSTKPKPTFETKPSSSPVKSEELASSASTYDNEFAKPLNQSAFLIKNQDKEITNLIKNYYDAMLNADKEAYDRITVDDDSIDIDILLRKMEYIIGYDNQQIYIAQGAGEIDLVAYIVYDLNINSIKTPAPSIDQLFIKNVDGNPKLYFNELTLHETKHLETIRNHQEVKSLIQTVNLDFKNAINSDSHLYDFYISLAERANSKR